jgi:hypothetical protein
MIVAQMVLTVPVIATRLPIHESFTWRAPSGRLGSS